MEVELVRRFVMLSLVLLMRGHLEKASWNLSPLFEPLSLCVCICVCVSVFFQTESRAVQVVTETAKGFPPSPDDTHTEVYGQHHEHYAPSDCGHDDGRRRRLKRSVQTSRSQRSHLEAQDQACASHV